MTGADSSEELSHETTDLSRMRVLAAVTVGFWGIVLAFGVAAGSFAQQGTGVMLGVSLVGALLLFGTFLFAGARGGEARD